MLQSSTAAAAVGAGIRRWAGATARAGVVPQGSRSAAAAVSLGRRTVSSSPMIVANGTGTGWNIMPHRRLSSTAQAAPPVLGFAVVRHGEAYEEAMEGRHGRQLALAYDEGKKRDPGPSIDPFAEFETNEDDDEDDEDEDDDYTIERTNETTKEIDDSATPMVDEEVDDDTDDFDSDEASDDEDEESIYNHDGSVRRPKKDLVALTAGLPAGGVFAVIELGGFQHKVTTDDLMLVAKLKPESKYTVGSTHTLSTEEILLMGSSHLTLVGLPHVTGGEVDIMVEEITRDESILVLKKRRRKHSRRRQGHRREVTFVRVLAIRLPEPYHTHAHQERVL